MSLIGQVMISTSSQETYESKQHKRMGNLLACRVANV